MAGAKNRIVRTLYENFERSRILKEKKMKLLDEVTLAKNMDNFVKKKKF